MLVLSRKIEEGIQIGDTIEIRVLDVTSTDNSGSRKSKVASIGIQAPRDIAILRKELREGGEPDAGAGENATVAVGEDFSGTPGEGLEADNPRSTTSASTGTTAIGGDKNGGNASK